MGLPEVFLGHAIHDLSTPLVPYLSNTLNEFQCRTFPDLTRDLGPGDVFPSKVNDSWTVSKIGRTEIRSRTTIETPLASRVKDVLLLLSISLVIERVSVSRSFPQLEPYSKKFEVSGEGKDFTGSDTERGKRDDSLGKHLERRKFSNFTKDRITPSNPGGPGDRPGLVQNQIKPYNPGDEDRRGVTGSTRVVTNCDRPSGDFRSPICVGVVSHLNG